jgi:hypothetical protein
MGSSQLLRFGALFNNKGNPHFPGCPGPIQVTLVTEKRLEIVQPLGNRWQVNPQVAVELRVAESRWEAQLLAEFQLAESRPAEALFPLEALFREGWYQQAAWSREAGCNQEVLFPEVVLFREVSFRAVSWWEGFLGAPNPWAEFSYPEESYLEELSPAESCPAEPWSPVEEWFQAARPRWAE